MQAGVAHSLLWCVWVSAVCGQLSEDDQALGKQLVQHHTKAEHITLLIVVVGQVHLRRHVQAAAGAAWGAGTRT